MAGIAAMFPVELLAINQRGGAQCKQKALWTDQALHGDLSSILIFDIENR